MKPCTFMNNVYKPHGITDAVSNLPYSFKESTSKVPNYKKLDGKKVYITVVRLLLLPPFFGRY